MCYTPWDHCTAVSTGCVSLLDIIVQQLAQDALHSLRSLYSSPWDHCTAITESAQDALHSLRSLYSNQHRMCYTPWDHRTAISRGCLTLLEITVQHSLRSLYSNHWISTGCVTPFEITEQQSAQDVLHSLRSLCSTPWDHCTAISTGWLHSFRSL